jgi:hypothetical protein
VVQLRPQSGPDADLFAGRAEHLASGTAARFERSDELLEFMRSVLTPQPPNSDVRQDRLSQGARDGVGANRRFTCRAGLPRRSA